MQTILIEQVGSIGYITLNRTDKKNAFDDILVQQLHRAFDSLITQDTIRVIVIRGNGDYFSAGADLAWMQRMIGFSKAENHKDAMALSNLFNAIYTSPLPTVAVVQGGAFGGGIGLIAACDIVIAEKTAQFAFTEVKIGLVPAVISPFIVQAIGLRAAKALFLTAETFSAEKALQLGLIHHCIEKEDLKAFSETQIQRIAQLAPGALKQTKRLMQSINPYLISDTLRDETAKVIAEQRVSTEGQKGLQAFLHKQIPNWDN